MPISPARTTAFDILLRVEREQAYAADLLHSAQYEKLSSADHGLATEIVMGVLRWQSLLDLELARFSSQKLEKLDTEVLVSLRMAAFQLMFLDRVPARAAVHESVELVKRARKRSAAPFVNALLRKITTRVEVSAVFEAKEDIPDLARRFAHPLWIVERWEHAYGWNKVQQIVRANQQVPTTAIRLTNTDDRVALEAEGIRVRSGQFLKQAALVESGDVSRSKMFRAGRVAIQDEGSQLVAQLIEGGRQILDCCAAPGGKTRIMAERNPAASITAVEIHPHRARLLRKLVGKERIAVVAGDARQLPLRGQFDRILVDVPCSGTGTLSRNPEIKWRLKPDDLLDLQARQIAILHSAMANLTPGGTLVYSTCSLEREENQDVVAAALASASGFQVLDIRSRLEELRSESELIWADLDSLVEGPFLRTLPGVHPCDGFFAAILSKS